MPPSCKAQNPEDNACPLTFGQEQLLLAEEVGDSGTLVFKLWLPLRTSVRVPLIAAALTRIIKTHDALRMSIVPGEPPVQVTEVSRTAEYLATGTHPDTYGLWVSSARAGRTPLYFWIDERKDPPRLEFPMHHMFGDAWSASLIAREFTQIYLSMADGARADLPPASSFADYARRQRALMTAEVLSRHSMFWEHELRGAQPLALPFTTGPWRPGARIGWFPAMVFELPDVPIARLREAASAPGGSVTSAFLAAFAIALSRQTSQRDLLLHIAVADRGTQRKRYLVGPLVNRCVLRLRLPADLGVPETVRVAEVALARTMRYQNGPGQHGDCRSNAAQALNMSPKVSVACNQSVVNPDDGASMPAGDLVRSSLGGSCAVWDTTANCLSDLHLELLPRPTGMPLRYQIAYRADLWHAASIQALGESLAVTLLGLAGATRPATPARQENS